MTKKTYKPYEVKPFSLTIKSAGTNEVVFKDTVRRWDAFSLVRDVYLGEPGVFENKMTVRGVNAILDSLIANPKTSFQFGETSISLEDDGFGIDDALVTIKWAGHGASKRGRKAA